MNRIKLGRVTSFRKVVVDLYINENGTFTEGLNDQMFPTDEQIFLAKKVADAHSDSPILPSLLKYIDKAVEILKGK